MEESLKFNSQICTTIKQSKKLLELGLKLETADMCHHLSNPQDPKNPYTKLALDDYIYIHLGEEGWEDTIPAWSMHRLIELYKDVEDTSLWSLENVNYNRLIQCISLAIKHGAFNKEYLKQ